MTDISRYKNACMNIETMELLKKQSKTICSAPLSVSKTIEHCSKFYEQYKDYIQYQIDKGNLKNIPVNKLAIVFCHEDDKVVVDAVAMKCAGKQIDCITLDMEKPVTLRGRNKEIYHSRVLADEKKTLQELGTKFGITRERVRQIQQSESKDTNANTN